MAAPSKPPNPHVRVRPKVTGLRLPGDLIKELKHIAIDNNKTLREVMIEAAQEYAGRYRVRKS